MFVKKKKLSCLDFENVGDGRHFEYLIRSGHKVMVDIFQSALNLTKKRILDF